MYFDIISALSQSSGDDMQSPRRGAAAGSALGEFYNANSCVVGTCDILCRLTISAFYICAHL